MITSTKKICIVLPHLTVGGTERTAVVLANYLAERGDEVTILLMYKKEIFYKPHPSVIIVEPKAVQHKLGKLLYIPYVLNFIRAEVKRSKPDIVFALGYMALTLVATVGLNTKVVISGRSSPSRIRFPGNRLLNSLYNFSHVILKGRVDGIIAQTKAAESVYQRRYSSPIQVIPNFLRDLKTQNVEKQNQIVTIGRCVREKGQHFLISAFARLNAPDWQLMIVGDGPKRAELETLAQTLGVSERVIFAGFQKDVDYFMAQSKIFALTSIIEGFPNALIEAMGTPLACVSFDCEAGPSEIISDGENGFLVRVGNVEKLSQRLQQLIDDVTLRNNITEQASSARNKYAIDKVGAAYRDFFLSL